MEAIAVKTNGGRFTVVLDFDEENGDRRMELHFSVDLFNDGLLDWLREVLRTLGDHVDKAGLPDVKARLDALIASEL
jgi:hypothetical protein